MAIRVEPQSMTEAGFADELMFGSALNEVDEPAVRCRQLRADLGQRQAPFLFRRAGVEGVDAAVPYEVPRWRAALEDERQLFLLIRLPPRSTLFPFTWHA